MENGFAARYCIDAKFNKLYMTHCVDHKHIPQLIHYDDTIDVINCLIKFWLKPCIVLNYISDPNYSILLKCLEDQLLPCDELSIFVRMYHAH